MLTDKQQTFLMNCDHRYNIKSGSVRSGKTFLDCSVTIPQRVLACRGEGAILLLGNTQQSINRNVLEPMRQIWGSTLVSDIKYDNTIELFGRKAVVLGAGKKTAVDVIRGMSVEYCYADEAVSFHPEVWTMLQSRLSCEHSHCDAACNPESPDHWFKKFLDTPGLDIYLQHYTIDDNTFLPPAYVANLKREYAGTVYYNRYILGEWTYAEGLIYRRLADAVSSQENSYLWTSDTLPPGRIYIGVDWGGSGSWHAFVATLITNDRRVIVLASDRVDPARMDADDTARALYAFCEMIFGTYGEITAIYCDSAEQILIRHCKAYMKKQRLAWLADRTHNSKKEPITDRIKCALILQGGGRFYYTNQAQSLVTAMVTALWDSKKHEGQPDTRLDNGSTDIDSLDAFEYTIERHMKELTKL